MFIPNLMATFSNEQLSHWLPQALSWQVIGAYCQTELGHGSNVRALETTFTYISEDDQFEVHSPTITSTKWWPGALGHTANHGIVYGRLILNGQDLGVHNFMVQLREFETHQPCKGIKVGDIGPKIGYNNQDNGFLFYDDSSEGFHCGSIGQCAQRCMCYCSQILYCTPSGVHRQHSWHRREQSARLYDTAA